MPKLILDYIANHPQHIPLIAQWHQNEWQHISPHLTTSLRIAQYSQYSNSPAIPSGILALVNGQAAGSASLVESDMESRPHLHPWIASVFVDKAYRHQGIATQLIEKCIDIARYIGLETLYLFTPDQTSFYQKRGWKVIETCNYQNEKVDIMVFYMKNKSDLSTI
jgi:GNAT superfamily N-acetyltransferase